jgi:hypothetical protein
MPQNHFHAIGTRSDNDRYLREALIGGSYLLYCFVLKIDYHPAATLYRAFYFSPILKPPSP